LDRRTTTPPGLHETGPKDTAFVPGPGITRFKATFDRRSRYIWHCHFVDHEDHGMMRPWLVV
jgi:FtsP/CotA-like multicopper oxidase with cupredoxin domain